ncbi:MAG: AAA family ATPase [Deltaproteobacteria bacterium]|nr:AAA family ATPase [Deltaproteobacteria bacterium]
MTEAAAATLARDRTLNLFAKPMTYVTGKGGVGKTTIAAAMALLAADQRRRVLVCELGSDGHLARLFGRTIDHEPTSVSPFVDAANFSAEEGLVATLTSVLPVERIIRAVVQNRVLQMFMETAPSVREAVLLDALGRHFQAKKYDNIIVDLPASGHAVTMLGVPQMIMKLMRRGPVAKKAEALEAEIFDPARAQILLVALPEALPVQETIELSQKLVAATRMGQVGIVLNSSAPHLVDKKEQALLDKIKQEAAQGSELRRHALHLLQAAERDEKALRELAQATGLPVFRLPRIEDANGFQDILGIAKAALASYVA